MTESWELAELVHHWGEAYSIMAGRDGYQAKRRDGQGGGSPATVSRSCGRPSAPTIGPTL